MVLSSKPVSTHLSLQHSDAARVQHNTAWSTERARRDVLGELGADDARVTVGTTNLAPDHAEVGVVLLLLRLVDVSHALAEVELRVLPGKDTLDLKESAVRVLVDLAPIVAEDAALGVQAHRLSSLLRALALLGDGQLLLLASHDLQLVPSLL